MNNKKISVWILILVICLYPVSASNMYNYVYNGSSWVPALATADGQQKYWIDMANATYGNVVSNLTVGESILVSGNLNVTGVSYLGDLTFDAENVTFKGGGDMYASGGSIFYNNGSETIDLRVRNIPENAVMSFNQASCPAGWILADGTSGTPDLRGIFVRGAGVSGSMLMANGTNFSATYGEYQNDSFQGHWHNIFYNDDEAYGGAGTTGMHFDTTTHVESDSDIVQDSITAGASTGDTRTGAETRPASYALIYCVKTAEDSATSNSIWQTIGDLITPVNSSKDFAINNSDFYVNVSSGNVGIGTSSPRDILELKGDGKLLIHSFTTNTSYTGSAFYENDFVKGYLLYIGSNYTTPNRRKMIELRGVLGGNGISLWGDGTSADMTINGSSGNVGIGTTSPGFRLQVGETSNYGWVASTGAWATDSDKRLKTNIEKINDALDIVNSIRGVRYNKINDNENQSKQIGFIAQEIETQIPEMVSTGEDGIKGLSYAKITPVLVNAIQELKQEKDSEIKELKTENDALKTENEMIKEDLCDLGVVRWC